MGIGIEIGMGIGIGIAWNRQVWVIDDKSTRIGLEGSQGLK